MGISTQLAFCCPTPFSECPITSPLHSECPITSPLHFSLRMGLIRLLMFHTSLASPQFDYQGLFLRSLSKVCFSNVPGFASVCGMGRPPGSAPPALDGRLSPQSTALSPGSLGDGRRRETTLRRRGFDFCRQPLLFGPGFAALGFLGRL